MTDFINPWDIFLLVIYGLLVRQIINQAIAKLDKRATVALNGSQLAANLEGQGLSGVAQFIFLFAPTYALTAALKMLSIVIVNTSDRTLYVDWDRSSLTNYGGRSRRVIRLTPYKSPDLIRPQALSMIPPGQKLQEQITAEDVLSRRSESDPLELTGVIVPIAPPPQAPPKFYLSLCLVVHQTVSEEGGTQESQYLLPFEFVITKRPWTDALPW